MIQTMRKTQQKFKSPTSLSRTRTLLIAAAFPPIPSAPVECRAESTESKGGLNQDRLKVMLAFCQKFKRPVR
jgi:hypothetical protein